MAFNLFSCFEGWEGGNCTDCIAMPGCLHGTCGDHPNTCECDEGWEGHLCDKPICEYEFHRFFPENSIMSHFDNFFSPACVNGVCAEGEDGGDNFCICHTGNSIFLMNLVAHYLGL